MDKLKECAQSFSKLFNTEYTIVAGKKSKNIEVTLFFHKEHFCHLIGLHKLKDLQIAKGDKQKIFDKIISDDLTYHDISKSAFFSEIADRFDYFTDLEQMLDSEEVLVKHNEQGSKSAIKADYIIYKISDDLIVHYFIECDKNIEKYYGKTFFLRHDKLYLRDRPYKILKKTKICNGHIVSETVSSSYNEIVDS